MPKAEAKISVRPQEENTEKRQRLLDAALKLFAERGFGAVGMREIAAAADVSLGLIRIHFGSKEGLRQELDAYVSYEIHGLYEHILELDNLRGVEGSLDDIVHFIKRDRYVMMYLRMALLQKTPGSQAMINDISRATRRFIDNCEKNGKLQPNVDKEQAALAMVFDLLGPMILEPFATEIFGVSMYDPDMITSRNKMSIRMMTSGFLKK